MVLVEMLVGRTVRDTNGRVAGRLEEVHADWRGEECVVTHYVLASKETRRGIDGTHIATFILRWLGAQKNGGSVVVPWDKLDPETLRLTCTVDELVGSPHDPTYRL